MKVTIKATPKKATSLKSIRPEIVELGFPENIMEKADEIYHSIDAGTRRGKRRKCLLFYCIYQSHKNLGIPVDPRSIIVSFGLRTGDMTEALSGFSELNTGFVPSNLYISPIDLLPTYARKMELREDSIQALVEFGADVLKNNPSLLDKFPQTVASGLLKYYLSIQGINLDMKAFAEIIGLSEATINTTCKLITTLDNS